MHGIGHLMSLINSASRAEKEEAIFDLGNCGSRAKEEVPFLLRLVKDPSYSLDEDLLGAIRYAIDEIGLGRHIASPEFLELLTDTHARVRAWAIGYLFFNFYTDYIPSINQEVLLQVVRLLEDHEPLSPGEGQSHLTDNGWWAFCLLDKWRPIFDVQLRVTEKGCDVWKTAACNGGDLTDVLLGIVALSFFPSPRGRPLRACSHNPRSRHARRWLSRAIGWHHLAFPR